MTRKQFKQNLEQAIESHDGYISNEDFEQLTEMYKLYTGLGGNGQAKEYYEKVLNKSNEGKEPLDNLINKAEKIGKEKAEEKAKSKAIKKAIVKEMER